MKFQWILASLATVLFAAGAHAQTAPPVKTDKGLHAQTASPSKTAPLKTDPLKTDKDKTSYALGVAVGKSLQDQGADIVPNPGAQGLKDPLTDGKVLITDGEFRALMAAFQQAAT